MSGADIPNLLQKSPEYYANAIRTKISEDFARGRSNKNLGRGISTTGSTTGAPTTTTASSTAADGNGINGEERKGFMSEDGKSLQKPFVARENDDAGNHGKLKEEWEYLLSIDKRHHEDALHYLQNKTFEELKKIKDNIDDIVQELPNPSGIQKMIDFCCYELMDDSVPFFFAVKLHSNNIYESKMSMELRNVIDNVTNSFKKLNKMERKILSEHVIRYDLIYQKSP